MKILYIGNFGSPRTTENAYKYAFEKLGHTVTPIEQTFAHTAMDGWSTHADSIQADLVLYTRTHNNTALMTPTTHTWRALEDAGIPTASVHLDVFVGVKRHGMHGWNDPLFTTQHVFTPDPMLAQYIDTEHTTHHWLPPAADIRDADMPGRPIAGLAGKVVFVGSRYGIPNVHPEYPWRAELLDWLRMAYNNDFYWYGGGSPLGVLRGQAVWDIYASDCILVGDSCFAGQRPYYWSDRVPESIAHGGLITHPDVEGILDAFPGMHRYTAGDFDSLKQSIQGNLVDLAEDRALVQRERAMLRDLALEHHTYVNRAREILDTLGLDRG